MHDNYVSSIFVGGTNFSVFILQKLYISLVTSELNSFIIENKRSSPVTKL